MKVKDPEMGTWYDERDLPADHSRWPDIQHWGKGKYELILKQYDSIQDDFIYSYAHDCQLCFDSKEGRKGRRVYFINGEGENIETSGMRVVAFRRRNSAKDTYDAVRAKYIAKLGEKVGD